MGIKFQKYLWAPGMSRHQQALLGTVGQWILLGINRHWRIPGDSGGQQLAPVGTRDPYQTPLGGRYQWAAGTWAPGIPIGQYQARDTTVQWAVGTSRQQPPPVDSGHQAFLLGIGHHQAQLSNRLNTTRQQTPLSSGQQSPVDTTRQ